MNKFKEKAAELNKTEEKTVVKEMIRNKVSIGGKDKLISAKVNSTTYEKFSDINKIFGISNNSCINQLITKYVLENQKLLDK